eukprot:TRINITY_DN5375_c0_g1_i1.p1 TRINITY_DN5375_c0_g1~~TRINITY_DN5375_c0_g1_i1.p1  ORF type:complete len:829 (+),score=287.88 TRINITY_DN5375_c0_g1_i1:133-2619(+)
MGCGASSAGGAEAAAPPEAPFYQRESFRELVEKREEEATGAWGWLEGIHDTPAGAAADLTGNTPPPAAAGEADAHGCCNSSEHSFEVGTAADSSRLLFRLAAVGAAGDLGDLLVAGCDPDVTDDLGQTPLHVAAHEGHLRCVMALADAGAFLNAADAAGRTPLQAATRALHNDVSAYLLDRGAALPRGQSSAGLARPASRGEDAEDTGVLARHCFNKMLTYARLPARADAVPLPAVLAFLYQCFGIDAAQHHALRGTLLDLSRPLDRAAQAAYPRGAAPGDAEAYAAALARWAARPLAQLREVRQPTATVGGRAVAAAAIPEALLHQYVQPLRRSDAAAAGTPRGRHHLAFASTRRAASFSAPAPPGAGPARPNPRGRHSMMHKSHTAAALLPATPPILSVTPPTAEKMPRGGAEEEAAAGACRVVHFEDFFAFLDRQSERGFWARAHRRPTCMSAPGKEEGDNAALRSPVSLAGLQGPPAESADARKPCPLSRLVLQKTPLTNWMAFTTRVHAILRDVKAEFPGDESAAPMSVSITTVDGQQFAAGPCGAAPMLACSQLFSYADVVERLGLATVTQYVGQSVGRCAGDDGYMAEMDFHLSNRKPANAATDGGAMLLLSLLEGEEAGEELAALDDKLARYLEFLTAMAGGLQVHKDEALCAAEVKEAFHTFAVANFLAAQRCFPAHRQLTHPFIRRCVQYYIMSYCLEAPPQVYANLCATLANFGVCPTTHRKVVGYETVKASLQLLGISGLGTFTGQWSCTVGVPARSNKAGVIAMVVPGSMGVCVHAPGLDAHGNSRRGVRFAEKFSERFRGGSLDQLYFGGHMHL